VSQRGVKQIDRISNWKIECAWNEFWLRTCYKPAKSDRVLFLESGDIEYYE